MADEDRGVILSEVAVQQIQQLRSEVAFALQQVQGSAHPGFQVQRNMVFIAKTTSEITALSGSTAGTGTVDIYERRSSDDELIAIGPEQTVFNCVATSIATDSWVMIQQDAGGDWWVTVEDC